MFKKIQWGSLKVWLAFACGTLNLKTFSTGGIPHAGCRQMPAFPTHVKRRWSQFESWKKLQGSCHHSKRPIYAPIHSRYTWFPCTDSTITPSIDLKHDGRCDSPVAPQEKATDPYGNMKALPLLPILGPPNSPTENWKGDWKVTFSYLKEYPTFWLSFSIEILVQVPHLNFFWWLSL